jgi:hypothetical protein
MSRTPIPFAADDVATLARAIERALTASTARSVPGRGDGRPTDTDSLDVDLSDVGSSDADPSGAGPRDGGRARSGLGHVEILNLLARATGFRNYQHLRASHLAERQLDAAPAADPEPPVDHARIAKALRCFDAAGRLVRWPPKDHLRALTLWALWAALPARTPMTEREISDRLRALHLFGDHALLRRELVDRGLFTRTVDGRAYHRVERRPPPDARALIRRLAGDAAP